jgi:hypothetical protein
MPEFVFGLFLGAILSAIAICAVVAGSKSERIPLEEVNLRVEAAADKAFRDGKLVQSLAQHEKDRGRALKAAQTRRAKRTAAELALESEAF